MPLFTAYYRRGQEKFRKAKEIVESGALGKLTSVQYSMLRPAYERKEGDALPWRFRAHHSGGGLIMVRLFTLFAAFLIASYTTLAP